MRLQIVDGGLTNFLAMRRLGSRGCLVLDLLGCCGRVWGVADSFSRRGFLGSDASVAGELPVPRRRDSEGW